MSIRVGYLALVFMPVINRVYLFFPCLVLFLTASLLSFAGYTFMPTEASIYLLITVVFAFIAPKGCRDYKYPYLVLSLVLIMTVLVNLLSSGQIEKVSYSFLLLLFLPVTVREKEKEYVTDIIPKLFVLSTTSCAVLTLLNQQLLIKESFDYERLISGSLNYTCCTLGIGFVLALREFLKPSTQKFSKVFYAFCMMTLLLTVIFEASRGAMLAIVVSSVICILNQNLRIRTKIFVVISAILFVFVLYNNQVLDLLIYRVQSDTGTGTGRTEIWADKLGQHFNSFSLLNFLFGIGYEHTWNLGGYGHNFIGCHNDFVAFLIEYGIIGFVLFLSMIIYPIHVAKSKNVRSEILPLIAFIVITCMTLEPFSMGYLPYCFLMLYIYLRATDQSVASHNNVL
jgi:hypothetical protein